MNPPKKVTLPKNVTPSKKSSLPENMTTPKNFPWLIKPKKYYREALDRQNKFY